MEDIREANRFAGLRMFDLALDFVIECERGRFSRGYFLQSMGDFAVCSTRDDGCSLPCEVGRRLALYRKGV